MEQRKQDDKSDFGEAGPLRVDEDIRGQITWDGRTCQYAYHLVYAQESVWMLDMRLVSADAGLSRLVWRILRARNRREAESEGIKFVDRTEEILT